MTNNEKINNMSIDEKVNFICGIMANDVCEYCVYHQDSDSCDLTQYYCGDGIKMWLESEAEE